MERYLLFDAKCPVCSRLARAIEKESGGRLKVRSLYDREMQEVLNQTRPGWRWEPMLVEVQGKQVRVFSGLGMRLRMAIVLGWRRTYHVVQILREAGVGITGISVERRWFLRQAGLWTLGLTLSGLASLGLESTRLAAWASEKSQEFKALDPALRNGVGHNARSIGVRAYNVSRKGDETIVNFSHIDPSKQGTLHIQWFDYTNKATIKLHRGSEIKTLVWDGINGTVAFSDAEGRLARFTFSITDKAWVADSPLSHQILDENEDDVKLMASIASDFSGRNPNQEANGQSSLIKPAALCPDYSHPCRGTGYDLTRSYACNKAKQNAATCCSNQYCYGCYSYMSSYCDCACVKWDYLCMCSITGYPCKTC